MRGVLTGEELDVRGTDSKRAKSHRKGEPRRDGMQVRGRIVSLPVAGVDLGALYNDNVVPLRVAESYIDESGNSRVRVR